MESQVTEGVRSWLLCVGCRAPSPLLPSQEHQRELQPMEQPDPAQLPARDGMLVQQAEVNLLLHSASPHPVCLGCSSIPEGPVSACWGVLSLPAAAQKGLPGRSCSWSQELSSGDRDHWSLSAAPCEAGVGSHPGEAPCSQPGCWEEAVRMAASGPGPVLGLPGLEPGSPCPLSVTLDQLLLE